jgi:hypothetical protein
VSARLLILLAALVALALPGVAAAQTATSCPGWEQRTVASDLGRLENLEFDGRGGALLSVSDADAITRVAPAGTAARLVEGIESPGGLRVRWPFLYANTDNAAQTALAGSTAGTIERIDLRTGARSTFARGLVSPNGLVLLADGDALVSRALGSGSGITRVDAGDPSRPQPNWARVDGSNGLTLDAAGRWLYVALTFTPESRVVRVDVTDPARVEEVGRLTGAGPPKGIDDLAIDADGVLYLAANATGEVLRFDPASETVCAVATGLRQPSSVRIGCGPGWGADSLYVTSFDGTLREVRAPPGGPAVGASTSCAATTGSAPAGSPAPGAAPARTCRSRRRFTVSVPARRRGQAVARVAMTLGGRPLRVRRRAGRFAAVVDLRGRGPGAVTLRIAARTRTGRVVRERRTYRPCVPARA